VSKSIRVQFEVKSPDTIGFILDNVKSAASCKKLFEFSEYATIELEIATDKPGAPILSAKFVETK
jgi:hypothetical protein